MDWSNIPYTKTTIQKQCEFANIDFDSIDFDDKEWWHKNTWNKDQETKFKEWFIDFLKHSKAARKEIIRFPNLKSKKHLESVWSWWNLSYGFRIKND